MMSAGLATLRAERVTLWIGRAPCVEKDPTGGSSLRGLACGLKHCRGREFSERIQSR